MRFIKTITALMEQIVKLAVLYAELAGRVTALESGKGTASPAKPDETEVKFQKGLESILNYCVKPAGVNDEENVE